MANVNHIIEFWFSFCTKYCTHVWENVNLNTEIHCHFTYCIAILHFTFQIEFFYPYAFINKNCSVNKQNRIQTHDKNAGGAWDAQYSSNNDLSLEKKTKETPWVSWTAVPLKHDSHLTHPNSLHQSRHFNFLRLSLAKNGHFDIILCTFVRVKCERNLDALLVRCLKRHSLRVHQDMCVRSQTARQ